MIETKPLEIADFTFGITDYFIDGDPRSAQMMDNLVLNPNRKLVTRWGSVVVHDQLPQGSVRVSKITNLLTQIPLIAFQGKRCYFDDGAGFTELVGPGGASFFNLGDSQSVITDTEWREHLFFTNSEFASPQKVWVDDTGTERVQNAGLPDVPAGVSVSTPAGTGSTYLYSFCLKYTYKVGTVTFLDRGPVYTYPTAVVGGAITGGNTTTVTLPTALVAPENWDEANIEVEIYRTQDAGDVFYLVTTVPLGTVSYVDNNADTVIVTNETLYTTGDIASNDTPPKAKLVHVVNEFGYYAHIKEGTEIDKTLILQSKSADIDSVPAAFYTRAEQPVVGLSSIFDRPIVLCSRYIYRIDNNFADDGSGGMALRRIDDKAGCVSAQSVVRTHLGLFWVGATGFFWSDGFRVSAVSDHLNETFKTITLTDTRKKNIQGSFDPSTQRVTWSLSYADGTGEPDRVFVVDLKYGFLPDGNKPGATFTTWSGPEFKPTASAFINGSFYRGDTRGYILKHSPTFFTDPLINPVIASASWEKLTIKHTYKSCFMDFGAKFYRKFVPRILISAANTTNLSLGIRSSNDNNRVVSELKPIRYRGNITWGDDLPYWGDASARWNTQGVIEEWRRFPAGGLRCNYKQIILENAKAQIINSDVLGEVTVNTVTKTATLGGSHLWLSEMVDYYLLFEHDNYTNEFRVSAATSTTATYEDPYSNGPSLNGNYKFILKGYPKGEVLELNGYVIHWAYLSKSHTPYSASSQGGSPA